MEMIFNAIDKIEETLGHSPHPAMTDVPVGAWVVSGISDVMGVLTGRKAYDDCARVSMGIGLVGAVGAAITGLRDYSFIPLDRQPSHEIATRHALNNAVAGTLYTASYLLRSRSEQAGRRTSFLARLLGLAGAGVAVYSAGLGGKLVLEMGEAVKPMIAQQDEQAAAPRQMDRERGDGAALGEAWRRVQSAEPR